MGLFVKKTVTHSDVPAYSISHQEVWLIVGLGNIGDEYEGTRHNLGFASVDGITDKLALTWSTKPSLKCSAATAISEGKRLVFCKPTTYMNDSGQSIQLVKKFYKVALNHVIVLHDELDLPLGEIRSKLGGGSAGHNGISSTAQHIGEDFWRIRMGIGPKHPEQIDSADFVLGKFTSDESVKLSDVIEQSISKTRELINQ